MVQMEKMTWEKVLKGSWPLQKTFIKIYTHIFTQPSVVSTFFSSIFWA